MVVVVRQGESTRWPLGRTGTRDGRNEGADGPFAPSSGQGMGESETLAGSRVPT
jgi:hypothetical protein